jgi:hypothetical protein
LTKEEGIILRIGNAFENLFAALSEIEAVK